MAGSHSQRMAAFLLAAVFLVTTIGTTAYVVYQINEDDVFVQETEQERLEFEAAEAARQAREEAAASGQPLPCGQEAYDAVDPRPLPEVTTNDGAIGELQTVDVKEGDGEEVQPGDCVAALYYGTLAADGSRFDGNYEAGTPIEFSLNGVITGWTEGIPGMKVGGVRRLLIPAGQAYGPQERSGIPANSDLIFEVEIISTRRGET